MDYIITPPEKVLEVWPYIEAWVDISRGVDRAYSVEDIRDLCSSGTLDLWVVAEEGSYYGFLIGTIVKGMREDSYSGCWLGGRDLDSWVKEGLNHVEDWARAHGCAAYNFIGRKAWKKLIGYDYEGVYYYKRL